MRAPLQPERDQVRGRERHDYIAWNALDLLWEIAFETSGYRHLAQPTERIVRYRLNQPSNRTQTNPYSSVGELLVPELQRFRHGLPPWIVDVRPDDRDR